MWVARNRKIGEILERLHAALRGEQAREGIPPQHLHDLDVEQMRCVQRLALGKQSFRETCCRRGTEQYLDQRGSVDDDQCLSRSARTAFAGDGVGRTDERRTRRARNSAIVGRSAMSRISRTRYSDSDMPAKAARAFSFR